MAILIGLDAKAYFGPAGTTAASELENIRNLNFSLEKGEADITTRKAKGWELIKATLKKGSINFEMLDDDEDSSFATFSSAFFNDDQVAMLVLDKENGEGLDADFEVVNFSRKEELVDAIVYSVSVKPTYVSRAPQWVGS